jgi:hypothetical protein
VVVEAWMPRILKPNGRCSLPTCPTTRGYALLFDTRAGAQAVVDLAEKEHGFVGTVERVRATIEYIDEGEVARG